MGFSVVTFLHGGIDLHKILIFHMEFCSKSARVLDQLVWTDGSRRRKINKKKRRK